MNSTRPMLASMSAVRRMEIGRLLTRRGMAGEAEALFSWTDAFTTDLRETLVSYLLLPYNSYERAIAFETAGNRERAIVHYQRFLETVDRPTGELEDAVRDARGRLARLTGDSARR